MMMVPRLGGYIVFSLLSLSSVLLTCGNETPIASERSGDDDSEDDDDDAVSDDEGGTQKPEVTLEQVDLEGHRR